MSVQVQKTGIVNGHFFGEDLQTNKAGSFMKKINNNLIYGLVDALTNKNGQIHPTVNTLGVIGAATLQANAGQTLCLSYEVCTSGARYSTEQGQTAWNQVRYGVHGSCFIDNVVQYPFTNYLEYSGDAKRVYMTWTIPSGTTYTDLSISVQTFDKPASTNNAVWYLRNLKIELSSYPTPYITSDFSVAGADALSFADFMET